MTQWTSPAQPVRCIVDLTAPLTERRERGKLVQGDKNANAIVIEAYLGKDVPYDLTGSTVTLTFVRPDKLAVSPIKAEITGNVAVMTLTEACYRYSGMYGADVALKNGEMDRTIVRVLGDIISTGNDGVVDEEHLFPSPEELLETLEKVEQARNNANTAAQHAENAASAANEAAVNIDAKVAEANAELSGKVNELSEEINEARGDSPNLFNASSDRIKTDTIINSTGYVSMNSYAVSHPILMKQGCTYQYIHDANTFGSSRIYAECDPDTGDVIATHVPSASDDGVFNFITPLYDMWVAVNIGHARTLMDTFMVCEADKYPETYVPYGKTNLKDGILQITEDALPEIMPPITPEMTTFLELKESENLFDKNSIIAGEFYQTSGAIGASSKMFRYLVPVKAGTYSFAGEVEYFGSGASLVPLFDANENFVTRVMGVVGDAIAYSRKVVTYTVTDDMIEQGVVYAGYSAYIKDFDTIMYVNSDVYPAEYIAYGNLLQMPKLRIDQENNPSMQANTLYGKTAVFDGDSICAGDGDGWAGRIGELNKMNWKNVSVGGATITSGLYKDEVARHWLSANIDTIHANHPKLDYLIFEGGTNDADLLSDDQIGTLDPNDFSGEYDATTFFGALDTLFYKALSYYPQAKIGFIIAQRMGTGTSSPARRRAFFDRITEACAKWAIPYIDLWHCAQLNPNLPAYYDPAIEGSAAAAEAGKAYFDGQHLTSVGYDIITPKIEAWMRSLVSDNQAASIVQVAKANAELTEKMLTKAPAIECEVSGSMVSITDAAAQPAVQLISRIEPVQEGEGDPSPDNIRSISGWDKVNSWHGDANLLNPDELETGGIQANGIELNDAVSRRRTPFIYLGAGTYAITTKGVIHPGVLHEYSTSDLTTWIKRIDLTGMIADDETTAVFTLNESCYIRIVFVPFVNQPITSEMITEAAPVLCKINQTLTAALPETVYGGTLDWESGVLTVDRAVGKITSNTQLAIYEKEGKISYQHAPKNYLKYSIADGLCSHYAKATSNGTNNTVYFGNSINFNVEYNTKDDFYAYLDAQDAAGTPVVIVYMLETPYTIQLTSQQLDMLKGTNNVWSDCGDTELVYVADSKMYIDNKFAELQNAILAQGANI